MQQRFNRDPTYDLIRHIASGEKVPLSGEPEWSRRLDAELERSDPMDEFTKQGETTGLQTQMANEPGKEPVNMMVASNCFDSPEKGGLSYGPKNVGEDYAKASTGGDY